MFNSESQKRMNNGHVQQLRYFDRHYTAIDYERKEYGPSNKEMLNDTNYAEYPRESAQCVFRPFFPGNPWCPSK